MTKVTPVEGGQAADTVETDPVLDFVGEERFHLTKMGSVHTFLEEIL